LKKFRDAADPHADHYPVAVAPVVDAGLATFISADGYKICDEIRLLSTPGHTAGHACVVISSKGHDAVITGDLIHNPLQCAIPEHPVAPDEDKTRGARTRRQFMERFGDTNTMILGAHFPPPTGGWIVGDGIAWRFNTNKP
jgi:glyoxylase-like metal-dependent hydrolase (beta-lactamase superfamily II)